MALRIRSLFIDELSLANRGIAGKRGTAQKNRDEQGEQMEAIFHG
jgi:hypothetical protein